jgi:hypothetical protein
MDSRTLTLPILVIFSDEIFITISILSNASHGIGSCEESSASFDGTITYQAE